MKKIFFILALLGVTLVNQSFVKDFANKGTVYTRPWSVSGYGFLIFPSVYDLDDYITFVQTKTHAQIQQYIQDSLNGFSSLGATLLSSPNDMVTEDQAYNYAMNTYRIIQTEGVVLRPVSPRECSVNFEFILAITPAYLNSTT